MGTRNIDAGKAIGYGWATVKKDLWYFVGIAFLYMLLGSIGSTQKNDRFTWNALGTLISALLTAGYLKIALSYFDGKKLPFQTLFDQFKYFWRVLGATILVSIIITVGFVFLVVPGVYFALRFQFVMPLIVDRDLGILAAMRKSTEMTIGMKLSLLRFDLLCLGVMILGAICFGVGILVALPVVWLAGVLVYRQTVGTAHVDA